MSDPRLTPARQDLAAAHLRGKVEAAHYVEGQPRAIEAPLADLRRYPREDAVLETQALQGEPVTVYEDRLGWSWVQLGLDGYVGYINSKSLGPPTSPTHRVTTLRTHAYPGPSIKSPPLDALAFGARVVIAGRDGDFATDAEGRFFWARHLARLDEVAPDFVAVAEMFLHSPYQWGGRTLLGIDCSGLVQTGLRAAGVTAPRDSDMLEKLGAPVDGPLKRGDLVFWKGHVGMVQDAERLLHANGFHMAVVSEPLAEARARIAASGGGEVTSIRRL